MTNWAILEVSDGTTTVNLLQGQRVGFHLKDWRPAIIQPKGGGVFQDSPIAPGRRLVFDIDGTAIESFDLAVNNYDQNGIIRQAQDLARLLLKARAYGSTEWQDEPVWIKARATCEDNARYALIINFNIPGLGNPYAQPFFTAAQIAAMDDIALSIERDHWLSEQPGTGAAVEASSTYTFNSRTYGTAVTTAAEVAVGNKQNLANLTHIYRFDASSAGFSSNLIDAALPYDLFPDPAGNGDIIYFGIQSTITDSGPFSGAVLDITTIGAGTYTVTWEYWDGSAWTAFPTVFDASTGFAGGGVRGAHWAQPSDWSPTVINGITAFWARARISAFTDMTTVPQQGNRQPYTATQPWVAIDDAQVGGDIEARMRCDITNISGGVLGPDSKLHSDRVIISLRSTNRGSTFTPYINISDEQNENVTIFETGSTTFATDVTTPTGRRATYNPTVAHPFENQIEIFFGSSVIDYQGRFRAFIRCQRVGGGAGEIKLRLATLSGGVSAIISVSKEAEVFAIDWQLLDLGEFVVLPPQFLRSFDYSSNAPEIFIQASNTNGSTPGDVYLYDLILMPVDEYVGEFLNNAPFINRLLNRTNHQLLNFDYIRADSITDPKEGLTSIVFNNLDSPNREYDAIGGELFLQSNADQRLWFLAAQWWMPTGSHTGANDAATLTDSAGDFVNRGIRAGMIIWNFNDGSFATITTVTATTIAGTLQGGTGNDWDTNDVYYVFTDKFIALPYVNHIIQIQKVQRYLGMRGDR